MPRARVVHRQPPRVDAQLQTAVEDAGVLTLAGGVPADELFPAATLGAAMERTIREDGGQALQYGWPVGHDRLREWIVAWMADRGVTLTPEQVLITSGAQQGLCLLGNLLVPEGSPIAVESPTYVAALQALDLRRPRMIPVLRDGGLDRDALRAALRDARVLYAVPSGHNPTGGVLDRQERLDLLEIAADADAWVLDDDAYGEVQFGPKQPPLRSFGVHLDRVLHLGSFSKVLAPGLRVGWIAGPTEVIRQATLVKQAQDLETATLTQRVLSHWLADNDLDAHIRRCLPVYRSRRDALLSALQRRCASLGTWTTPHGGFSLLFRPSAERDARALLEEGLAAGVAWEPAAPYYPDGGRKSHMRLSFANVREADIAEAVARLARVLEGSR